MQGILCITREGLRQWLRENHDNINECYIAISDGTTDNLSYLDAVEEALCFGWIDSTRKKDDRYGTVLRLSPRRKGSRFTQKNVIRCERLESLGLMTDAGRDMLPNRFKIDGYMLRTMKKDDLVMHNLSLLPENYVRIRLDNIQYLRKSDPETYKERLIKFMDKTREGKMFGEWDDGGKLPPGKPFVLANYR